MAKIKATIQLPPPGSSDVAKREVYVSVNGQAETFVELDKTATIFEYTGEANDEVDVWLVDVDETGNRSEQSDALLVTLADTFPPPKPAPLIVTNMEQVG